jgi:hypothetical protein
MLFFITDYSIKIFLEYLLILFPKKKSSEANALTEFLIFTVSFLKNPLLLQLEADSTCWLFTSCWDFLLWVQTDVVSPLAHSVSLQVQILTA